VSVENAAAVVRRLRIESSFVSLAMVADATVEQVYAHTDQGAQPACSLFRGTLRDSVCWSSGANTHALGTNHTAGSSASYAVKLRNVTAIDTGGAPGYGLAFDLASADPPNPPALAVDAKGVIADGPTDDVHAGGASGATTTITLDHSNFGSEDETGGGTVTTPGTGTNQTDAPLFADAANGDFHELIGSPTRNAGELDGFSGAVDLDGALRTQGGVPDIGAYEFDQIPPNTTITSGPSAGTTIADSTPSFGFASTEPGSTFQCRVDGAPFAACSSPRTTAALASGAHTLRVRATDASGNTDATPASRRLTFEVDSTDIKIVSGM
jgi:hypothetical protein